MTNLRPGDVVEVTRVMLYDTMYGIDFGQQYVVMSIQQYDKWTEYVMVQKQYTRLSDNEKCNVYPMYADQLKLVSRKGQ